MSGYRPLRKASSVSRKKGAAEGTPPVAGYGGEGLESDRQVLACDCCDIWVAASGGPHVGSGRHIGFGDSQEVGRLVGRDAATSEFGGQVEGCGGSLRESESELLGWFVCVLRHGGSAADEQRPGAVVWVAPLPRAS